MDFDALIVGGGAAGMSCALILGSGLSKEYARDKKVGIIMHQKASHMQTALFNNVLGVDAGTSGAQVLKNGPVHLAEQYPEVIQIEKEKVKEVSRLEGGFKVLTNKNSYTAKNVVIAVGYTRAMNIKGLEEYVIPHQKAKASKERIQLKNSDHLVLPGLYVAGTLAGWRSQFSIASGSGASVATDILTEWNGGEHAKVHDKL
ncbi:FAD-dependent oxidoreductase [Salegentibacter chungangensis]|uniref:FAD-dependent oxidoreductase n=1 Tax=Salegentibacter chungangensis TaxID=1335724 RepID=A0ABW3NPR7_9FLAO